MIRRSALIRYAATLAALLLSVGTACGDATPAASPSNAPAPDRDAVVAATSSSSEPAAATASAAPDPSAAPSAPPRTRAVETSPPKRIAARHVLISFLGADRAGPTALRSRDQAMALIQEVQRRAKAGEDLGRLAVEFSDEPNAGARGGSLGRFGRGQMVPEFDAVVWKLKVGEISDIVETPFGFHIIQRTE